MQPRFFHSTKAPINVVRAFKSGELQQVVNNMYNKLGVNGDAPEVEMTSDPNYVCSVYMECVETICISKAALDKLPDYAVKGILANAIAHHYIFTQNINPNNQDLYSDKLAARLTSPQAITKALEYYLHDFDTDPANKANDRERINNLKIEFPDELQTPKEKKHINHLRNKVVSQLSDIIDASTSNQQKTKKTDSSKDVHSKLMKVLSGEVSKDHDEAIKNNDKKLKVIHKQQAKNKSKKTLHDELMATLSESIDKSKAESSQKKHQKQLETPHVNLNVNRLRN